MNANQIRLMALCLLATFIISGVVTTIGLLVPGAAAQFDVPITQMAAQFTWFTGGVFAGYVLSFVIFDYVSIRLALLVSYALCVGTLLLINLNTSFAMLSALLCLFGVGISIAVCGSGTLITQLWDGHARQTVIVAQDALFNGGGVVFSAVATWFVTREYGFSSSYLVVAGVVVVALVLALSSNFYKDQLAAVSDADDAGGETQWNVGFVIVGISLAVFMMAKITMFIWAPQYLVAQFAASDAQAGHFMSQVFLSALIGSLLGVWLVSRVQVKVLVYIYVVISTIAVAMLLWVDSLTSAMVLAYVYGFSVSATFNAYLAFSLTLVDRPNHRNIAYMLLMSSLGSSLAPLVSSWAVEAESQVAAALQFTVGALLVVAVTLVVGEILARSKRIA